MYCVRTANRRRTLRCRGVSSTSVRRCMSSSHVNATIASEITSFKIMDVEEPELKIAVVGLLWSLLQNERQRRHIARLRPGRNIVHVPIVRRGGGRLPRRWLVRPWLDAERRFKYGYYYRLMEENCDWKTATPSEISCGWRPQCLTSFYTKSKQG